MAHPLGIPGIGVRYAAACQTNGRRIEMITTANIHRCLFPLIKHWATTIGGGKLPEHIYYLRDGVSESQYQYVLQKEVRDMRDLLLKMNPAAKVSLRCFGLASHGHDS